MQSAHPATLWNSLEVAKLLVSALTPLAVLTFGFWINRRLKRVEHLQWASQKVIEKRLVVFDQVAPLLNDLLCYFTYVGAWKDAVPLEMVKLKRQLDRIIHVNAPLFPPHVLTRYNEFIGSCFSTFTGWGKDAKLRTLNRRRREAAGDAWKPEWEQCFAPEAECVEPAEIQAKYRALIASLAGELGIGLQSPHIPTGRLPANI
jgi:hypothetical protein